jgi:predicted PurR-regulated permease PerM
MALTGVAAAVIVALDVAFVWGMGRVLHVLGPVLWPLAVAGVLAYLLDPVVDWLERRSIPRQRAIVLVFITALAVVLALAMSVIPQMIRETGQLAERVPGYVEQLGERVENWVNHPPAPLKRFLHKSPPHAAPAPATNAPPAASGQGETAVPPAASEPPPFSWEEILTEERLESLAKLAASAGQSAVSWMFGRVGAVAGLFGVIASLALVPVYAFYLLLEKQGISAQWTHYLPVAAGDIKREVVFVLSAINDYMIAFFRGQVLVAICDGVLYGIGFALAGIPYAVLLGVLAVPLTIIPYVGAFLICGGALLIALVQHGDWLHPLLVLGVFAVVQTIEGFVIQPKIVGDRVGLHPLAIIIAVITGTTLLGGLLGGILAIPLAAAARVILLRYVWRETETPSPSAAR